MGEVADQVDRQPPPASRRTQAHAAPSATAGSSEGAVCECGRACLPASQGVAVGYGGSEGGSRLPHASPPGTYWVSLPRGLDGGGRFECLKGRRKIGMRFRMRGT